MTSRTNESSRLGRPTPEESVRMEERLRQAAIDTFLDLGYDRTTMEAVARAAGITKRTLYARYPDKRALFLKVISWALARQEQDSRILEPIPDDLTEGLMVIARTVLARAVDPDRVRLARMAITESTRFPEFAANFQSLTWSPRMRAVMEILERHAREGTIVVEDPELSAEHFLAMVGAMPAWLAAFGISRSPRTEERRLRRAVTLFVSGVSGQAPGTTGTTEP